jgi:hypothetical protein
MKKSTTKILGIAAVAFGAWYLFGRSRSSSSSSTTAIRSTGTGTPLPSARPLGDPNDFGSVAHACNAAWMLTAIGHPQEAATWVRKCTAGGGTVPTSATDQYT